MNVNKFVLKEIEHQVTIAIGSLSMVEKDDEDNQVFVDATKAQLIGVVHGIRNLLDHLPDENEQFQQIVPEKDCSDVYPGLY